MADESATDKDMITVITEECNEISQDFYNSVMDSVQLSQMECSCGHSACLVGHGSYARSVKAPLGKFRLTVRRVQCNVCGVTHALLPSGIVPYSQVPLADHVAIASSYEGGGNGMDAMDKNPELTPSQVWYILSPCIRLWRQRLLSERISLSPARSLTRSCLRLFARQFMQVKRTRNLPFSPPA